MLKLKECISILLETHSDVSHKLKALVIDNGKKSQDGFKRFSSNTSTSLEFSIFVQQIMHFSEENNLPPKAFYLLIIVLLVLQSRNFRLLMEAQLRISFHQM